MEGWIVGATHFDWDDIAQEYTKILTGAAERMRSATRTFLGTAARCGALILRRIDGLASAFAPDVLRRVVRAWTDETDRSRRISARTAHDYLGDISVVLERAGHDAAHIRAAMRTNRFLKEGRRAGERMTGKNKRFCQSLLDRKDLRLKFTAFHVTFRKEAERILAGAAGRALTGTEITELRQYGSAACFAALETEGAPLRIQNALDVTISGPAPWLSLPARKSDRALLVIPPAALKNGESHPDGLKVPIRPTRYRGLETIVWFRDVVRPLFPHAEASPFLFPAVEKPGASLPYETFDKWFQELAREVDFPMTCHQFRHGQASMLLRTNPGDYQLVADRLGDTVETVRRYYGWIDKVSMMERGQDKLMESV